MHGREAAAAAAATGRPCFFPLVEKRPHTLCAPLPHAPGGVVELAGPPTDVRSLPMYYVRRGVLKAGKTVTLVRQDTEHPGSIRDGEGDAGLDPEEWRRWPCVVNETWICRLVLQSRGRGGRTPANIHFSTLTWIDLA